MVHCYKLGGLNIVLDICSGSVHVVDEVVYDIIEAYESRSKEEIIAEMLEKYASDSEVTREELEGCFEDIENLKAEGKLFSPDNFEGMAGKLKEKSAGVVKALCLHIAHSCNLNCSYCFASQGKYRPGVMKCYYKDPKATDEILGDDGWLYTGDMAREDEDGFIWLVDRKKDVIISGGENIYPVQIEDFLRSNAKIKDVAVIGIPEKRLGEITLAVIELKDGEEMTEEEVATFCLELPRYKRPRKVVFAKVPRNPTGKIEKPVLRKQYAGESLVLQQIKN